MIQISNNLTTRNYTNGSGTGRIKYIVVHYTAGNGDTAKGNTNYFKSTYRGASAHYFVDSSDTIWRCVEDHNISWHCGGGLQGSNGHTFHKICTNSNSIGIEMCSIKTGSGYYDYSFNEKTISNCVELVKYLMNKYNIPISNVIRHYDVTGKICPAPFVNNPSAWDNFKARLYSANDIPELTTGIYKVTATTLNIRAGVGTSYSKVGELSKNTEVIVSEIKNNWGKIDKGWISLSYTTRVGDVPETEHWAKESLDKLVQYGYISDENQWNAFDETISKALAVALLDKASGGTWYSQESNQEIHWCHPFIISLCGKGILTDVSFWTSTIDSKITKGLLLAMICNMVGGISSLYVNRITDHWARNCLDTLCDKGIIQTPTAWTDFEGEVSKGSMIALTCKAINR